MIAPSASIARHPASPAFRNPKPDTNPNNMPTLVAVSLHVTSLPLCFGGETSAIYTGSMANPRPTPRPVTNRPIINEG